jgi:predicted RNA methylase
MPATSGAIVSWAERLGLIEVPLFSRIGPANDAHVVLLDGGRGSFALSATADDPNQEEAASWAWSADLSHHVHLSKDHVTLLRWDEPTATRRFRRSGVEAKLESFYEYLRIDRVQSSRDIVEHSVDVFRRLRSHTYEQGLPETAGIHLFLYTLGAMLSGISSYAVEEPEVLLERYSLDPAFLPAFRGLGAQTLGSLIEQYLSPIGTRRNLHAHPELMLRHAAGTVFQEAHFELIRSSPSDLFGLAGPAEVRVTSRGGTHFTPPGLARAVVERTIQQVALGERITILDPACGSGAFLLEALRYLQRAGYIGKVHVIGYDTSAAAVPMARFVLNEAARDWPAGFEPRISIEERDSLADDREWDPADVILMNPPFISWGSLDRDQRQQLQGTLGKWYRQRPDYSMAFVEKALQELRPGGAVGTLMPASLLSLDSARKWREHLLDLGQPTFLGVLGDYSLFRHAMVEVACAIFSKRVPAATSARALLLWTSETEGASSEALRNLRRSLPKGLRQNHAVENSRRADEWSISSTEVSTLLHTPDWRPRPRRLERILDAVQARTRSTGELFHVAMGVRTGARDVFIVSREYFERFGDEERRYFRPIAENRNIKNGRILPGEFLFYPYTDGVPALDSEEDLQRRVPTYYSEVLKPKQSELSARSNVVNRGDKWWSLGEARSYFRKEVPKLVSSYFGDAGTFAWDSAGGFVVVQGFAWFARARLEKSLAEVPSDARSD